MGVPKQDLPAWGGALGQLADAIKACSKAIDGSKASNSRVTVTHGFGGALQIGGVEEDGHVDPDPAPQGNLPTFYINASGHLIAVWHD